MTGARAGRLALAGVVIAAVGLAVPAAAAAAAGGPPAPPLTFGLFGIDVGELVEKVVRSIFDLLVPDFSGEWATRLVTWMVAVPAVTDPGAFAALNAYRRELTHVGFGLLGLAFASGAIQLWMAGFSDSGRFGALEAFKRAAIGAGALVTFPTLMTVGIQLTNLTTAAMVTHPKVVDGLNVAIGSAFVLATVSAGLSLGLALGAGVVCVYFLAAIFVMKIGLTVVLCCLLVGGALVWGLYPMPGLQWLPRLWMTGLVAALSIPVVWAVIFSVAALVSSDALTFSDGLGQGLEAAVKPFVAVCCFYLTYKAPGFMLACARSLGFNMTGLMPTSGGGGNGGGGGGGGGGRFGGPGGRGPGAIAARAMQTNAARLNGLRHVVSRPVRAGMGHATQAGRRAAAPPAAFAAAAAGPSGSATAAAAGAGYGAARGAARGAAKAAGGARRANDWWRNELPRQGHAARQAARGARRAPHPAPDARPGSTPPGAEASPGARRGGARKPRRAATPGAGRAAPATATGASASARPAARPASPRAGATPRCRSRSPRGILSASATAPWPACPAPRCATAAPSAL